MADLSTPLQLHETYFSAFSAHFDELKKNLETKQVATRLFQERILTVAQFRAFTKNVTEVQIDYEINHEILNLMMDKTVGDFLKFLNAITLPPSTCRSIGEKIKRVISPTNTDGRSSHDDGGSSHQELDTQILDKWGNELRSTFDYFAEKLPRKHLMKVANKLRLDEQAIEDITYEQHASAYNQYYMMFTAWNQSRGKSATLRAFIDALTQVETKTIIDGYYLAVQSGKISWD